MNSNLSSKIYGTDISKLDTSGLPKTYNDTKIVLLPKDSVWAYVYWEISNETQKKFANLYGSNFNPYTIAIRVYDITDISFDGKNANRYFDIIVDGNALSWYINLGQYNRTWCVDLGYVLKDGTFVCIVRSNILRMPKYGISDITDLKWALFWTDFEKLSLIGKSSKEQIELLKQRMKELINLPSSANSSLLKK